MHSVAIPPRVKNEVCVPRFQINASHSEKKNVSPKRAVSFSKQCNPNNFFREDDKDIFELNSSISTKKMSAIGIMDGAFFVGRKEVVDWINSTLDISISKIEDTATGAIACQLLDIMHPGQVPMHKVNWSAKQNFELVANYKILQTAFSKLHIDKFVDVDRLISGRYMDNLEFMQWFKRFYEMNVADKGDYDCIGQRSKGKGNSSTSL